MGHYGAHSYLSDSSLSEPGSLRNRAWSSSGRGPEHDGDRHCAVPKIMDSMTTVSDGVCEVSLRVKICLSTILPAH